MNKDVIISVTGNRNSQGDENFRMELVTEGKYYRQGDKYYVTYDESEVTGMKGTTTTIEVSGGTITLTRSGSVNSRFVFEKGQKHISYYDTAYGAFTVGIMACDVFIDIDDNGGSILVDYSVEIDNSNTGRSDFCMWIREARNTIGQHNRNNQGTNN
jgi:uncharacterized beta-barrel protein YwiB (DUF1934 family)